MIKLSDNNFRVNHLPFEIKNKICSYLYFSKTTGEKIIIVNESVKNYKNIVLCKLYSKYGISLVGYFILKYFLYDKINCETLSLDYEMLSKSDVFQHEELRRIISMLRPLDLVRIFKYINKQGGSSEYFIY
tara:strand:+ start:9286 stop:9678 length:393 start_codon:yes stop_codon:yes gene_type:complete